MGVKIPDWKAFHVVKQFLPQDSHGSLTDIYHNSVIEKRTTDPDGINNRNASER